MRRYKCCECGNIVTERWMRKQSRERGYVLDYTSPCPCGCPEWYIVKEEAKCVIGQKTMLLSR